MAKVCLADWLIEASLDPRHLERLADRIDGLSEVEWQAAHSGDSELIDATLLHAEMEQDVSPQTGRSIVPGRVGRSIVPGR